MVSDHTLLEIIKHSINQSDINRSFIYRYKNAIGQGEVIGMGPGSVTMPFAGTLLFVDLAPGSNWAHPCMYLLVAEGSLDTRVVVASYPPGIEQRDENCTLILRYGAEPPSGNE